MWLWLGRCRSREWLPWDGGEFVIEGLKLLFTVGSLLVLRGNVEKGVRGFGWEGEVKGRFPGREWVGQGVSRGQHREDDGVFLYLPSGSWGLMRKRLLFSSVFDSVSLSRA